MLNKAYLLAKIVADTAENAQHVAESLTKFRDVRVGWLRAPAHRQPRHDPAQDPLPLDQVELLHWSLDGIEQVARRWRLSTEPLSSDRVQNWIVCEK